jgi:hypothetical protein
MRKYIIAKTKKRQRGGSVKAMKAMKGVGDAPKGSIKSRVSLGSSVSRKSSGRSSIGQNPSKMSLGTPTQVQNSLKQKRIPVFGKYNKSMRQTEIKPNWLTTFFSKKKKTYEELLRNQKSRKAKRKINQRLLSTILKRTVNTAVPEPEPPVERRLAPVQPTVARTPAPAPPSPTVKPNMQINLIEKENNLKQQLTNKLRKIIAPLDINNQTKNIEEYEKKIASILENLNHEPVEGKLSRIQKLEELIKIADANEAENLKIEELQKKKDEAQEPEKLEEIKRLAQKEEESKNKLAEKIEIEMAKEIEKAEKESKKKQEAVRKASEEHNEADKELKLAQNKAAETPNNTELANAVRAAQANYNTKFEIFKQKLMNRNNNTKTKVAETEAAEIKNAKAAKEERNEKQTQINAQKALNRNAAKKLANKALANANANPNNEVKRRAAIDAMLNWKTKNILALSNAEIDNEIEGLKKNKAELDTLIAARKALEAEKTGRNSPKERWRLAGKAVIVKNLEEGIQQNLNERRMKLNAIKEYEASKREKDAKAQAQAEADARQKAEADAKAKANMIPRIKTFLSNQTIVAKLNKFVEDKNVKVRKTNNKASVINKGLFDILMTEYTQKNKLINQNTFTPEQNLELFKVFYGLTDKNLDYVMNFDTKNINRNIEYLKQAAYNKIITKMDVINIFNAIKDLDTQKIKLISHK